MRNVKPPKFLDGLYRDMRDRRLLIPAIALVVALFAVPVLLKSQASSSAPAVAPTASSGRSADAAEPAVVTQQLGVTAYRKRLNHLSSKNPFHQQYTTPPKAAQLHVTSTGTGSSSGTGSSTSGSTSSTSIGTTTGTSTSPSTSSIAPPASSSGGVTPVSPSTSTSPPDTSAPPPKPPQPTLYAFRVSIAIGEPGDLKKRENVQLGVVLPSEKKPMAAFVGATEDLKTANFVLADTVDSVDGGHCVPSPDSCSLLQLKQGQEAHLHYAPQDRRYNLKLLDVRLVPVHKLSGKAANTSQKAPKGKSGGSGIGGMATQVVYGRAK